eukprot:1191720-Prorocentrum_minimum.AAC.4
MPVDKGLDVMVVTREELVAADALSMELKGHLESAMSEYQFERMKMERDFRERVKHLRLAPASRIGSFSPCDWLPRRE